jgi:phage terminase large subunit
VSRLTPEQQTEILLATPVGFAEAFLGMRLYKWQAEILNWYANTQGITRGAAVCPNGSGKSDIVIVALALWWVSIAKQGTVVITSKDSKQLINQVWSGLKSHRDKFPTYEFIKGEVRVPGGGAIIGFTTDEAKRAEGWHSKLPDKPVLIIIDEAKSVADEIFTAFDRCTPRGKLYISSSGYMEGRFFDTFRDRPAGWKFKKVTWKDCPHMSKERYESLVAEYENNPNHPFIQSTFNSEFMNQDAENQFFVTYKALEDCLGSPPAYKPGDRAAFCDFAGGGDENVLAVRNGNKVELIRCWKQSDEMAAVGEFIVEFRRLGLKPEEIWGDNAGAGKPMVARFSEVGWPINRFNGKESAYNDRDFCNRNAEIWEEAGRMIGKRDVILPDDSRLRAQLTNRKRDHDSRGRMKCESKDDMRSRGVKSPDRADAVVGCMCLREPRLYGGKDDTFHSSWLEWVNDEWNAGPTNFLSGIAGD